MKFSVVTISYNQAAFLGDCIDSVRIASAGRNVQHIIVDPGSTDGSKQFYDVLRGQPSYVVIEEPDRGPADGLNKGFQFADGDIYYYLNADDLVSADAFEYVEKFFSRHPAVDILCGGGAIVNEVGGFIRSIYSTWSSSRDYVMGASVAVQQATFFRAAAFRRVGGFNESNTASWDGELLLDLVMAGCTLKTVPRRLGDFRVYATSITGSQRQADLHRRNRERMFAKRMGRSRMRRDQPEVIF